MTADTAQSSANGSTEESFVNCNIPEGPKTVALIPESLAGSNLRGSLMKSFFYTANLHLWKVEPMCLNIIYFVYRVQINFYIQKILFVCLMN